MREGQKAVKGRDVKRKGEAVEEGEIGCLGVNKRGLMLLWRGQRGVEKRE